MKKILFVLLLLIESAFATWADESWQSGIFLYHKDGSGVFVEGFTYIFINNNKDKASWTISIPETVVKDGNTVYVNGIYSNAFKDNQRITSVSFPNAPTFKYINKSAFEGCTGLTEITIPSGITGISTDNDKGLATSAFSGCSNLKTVTINNNTLAATNYTSGSKNIADVFTMATTVKMGANVTKIGDYAFYRSAGDFKLKTLYCNKATSIGENAFKNAKELSTVDFGEVTTIGSNAFANCTSLASVHMRKLASDANIPTSVKTYYIDSYLEEQGVGSTTITIPEISNTNVTKIVFGENVKKVGLKLDISKKYSISQIDCLYENGVDVYQNGFNNLASLRTFNGKPTNVNMDAFSGCTSLQSIDLSLCSEISYNGFKNCSSLTTLTNCENLKTIFGSAFMGCSNLAMEINSEKLTFIGDNAFNGCGKLTGVNAPNAYIKYLAFKNCNGLVQANFNSMELVWDYEEPFMGCTNLKKIKINGGDFLRSNFNESTYCSDLIVPVDTLEFGDDVSIISRYAFYNYDVKVVNFNKVKTIGDYAFANCSLLEKANCENVTKIGQNAFKGCPNLKSAVIGSSDKAKESNTVTIQDNAFAGCSALSKIEIKASNATVSSNAFTGVKPFVIVDLTDQVDLPSVEGGETIFITQSEARAKELRDIKIDGVSKYQHVSSVQRMGCDPADVDMNGKTTGADAQAVYNSMK